MSSRRYYSTPRQSSTLQEPRARAELGGALRRLSNENLLNRTSRLEGPTRICQWGELRDGTTDGETLNLCIARPIPVARQRAHSLMIQFN